MCAQVSKVTNPSPGIFLSWGHAEGLLVTFLKRANQTAPFIKHHTTLHTSAGGSTFKGTGTFQYILKYILLALCWHFIRDWLNVKGFMRNLQSAESTRVGVISLALLFVFHSIRRIEFEVCHLPIYHLLHCTHFQQPLFTLT